jgi:hypothetical protein
MDFNLTRFSDRPPDYWVSRAAATADAKADGGTVGLAESRATLAGKDFWKSPKGIAIIAGSAGVLLLAIAVSARKSSTRPPSTLPITPTTP